ncbi:MAG: hypothetical protein AAB776_02275 [Patescibacteria group bacterium]
MSKQIFLYITFFGLLSFSLLSYWAGLGGERNLLFLNIAYLLAPVFSVLGGLYAVKIYGWRGMTSRPFLFLTLGLLLWMIGEILWVYYDFVIEVTPYPSIADYFYLFAYVPLFLGLFEQVQLSKVRLKRFDPVIVFLFGIIAILMAGLATYFGIFLAYDSASTLMENAVAIGYGLADMVIILCALLVLILAWEFRGGSLMRFYMFIFFGFSMTFIADVGFAVYNEEYLAGGWWIRNTLDSLWIMQYLYFGMAFFAFGLHLKVAQERLIER